MVILILVTLLFAIVLSGTATAKDWNNTTIENNTGNGQSSIAVDNNGNVHISYYNATNGDLGYATKTKRGWVYETTDIAGCNPSLDIDNNGNPHIAYIDTINNNLAYATKSGDSWVHEDIASNTNAYWSNLVIDKDGNPNIAYTDNSFNLWYTKKINGTWIYENLGQNYNKPVLAIDKNNTLHLIYCITGSCG